MLSIARTASRSLVENSRQFSSLTLKSGYNPMLANALAQKYDVRYKSDGKIPTQITLSQVTRFSMKPSNFLLFQRHF